MINEQTETKYVRWYNRLMERAVGRFLQEPTEEHHIKPKSIYGEGPTVFLTPREHFIAHWLLTKMTVGEDLRKMQYAFNCMSKTRNNIKVTSTQYEAAKRMFLEALKNDSSRNAKISSSLKGRTFSEERKAKLREAAKTRKPQGEAASAKRSESLRRAHAEGRHAGMRGKKHADVMTPEAIRARGEKLSAALTGRPLSEEHRKKIVDSGFGSHWRGKTRSPETRARMAEARRLYWERKKGAVEQPLTSR